MHTFTDIHTHILFGVDDGARTLDESLLMLEQEYRSGVRDVILTPHFYMSREQAPLTVFKEKLRLLQDASRERFPDLSLYLGFEVQASGSLFDAFDSLEPLCLAGSRNFLMEFRNGDSVRHMKDRVREAQSMGVSVIVAHAERYEVIQEDVDSARSLTRMGAELQVNADSIVGKGIERRTARKLIRENLVTYVAGDAHNTDTRTCRFAECARYLARKYNDEYMRDLMAYNPHGILEEE